MKIKNSNIIIVGGSNKLVGLNKGKYIDSFDIVVKFNGSLFLYNANDFTKDYGKRFDLHFMTNPLIREKKPDLKKYDFVNCFLFKRDYKEYKDINRVIIKESFKNVESKMKKGFTYSGIAVLDYVLSCNLKSVELIGWDMYVDKPNYWDGDWSHYPEGYVPEEMKDLTARENADGHLAHSRYWNCVVLKEMIDDVRVTCSDDLRNNVEYILKNRKYYE